MNESSDISGTVLQPNFQPQPVLTQNELLGLPRKISGSSNEFALSKAATSRDQEVLEKDEETQERRGDRAPIFNTNHCDRQINEFSGPSQSKTSSVISQASSADTKTHQHPQKLYTTPSLDSMCEAKSSTFENSEQFSGARPNHYTSNLGTLEKKVKFNSGDADSQSQHDDESHLNDSDQKMLDNVDFGSPSPHNLAHFGLNGSSQKESGFSGHRERRSCRDKTTKYSLTHKGMISNNQPEEECKRHLNQRHSGIYSVQSVPQTELEHLDSVETNHRDNEGQQMQKPHKKSSLRTPEQCMKIIRDMLSFDWSLKDIANLRHSPQQELTSSIFWFYVSSLYFPFGALEKSKQPEDAFLEPILLNLRPVNNQNYNQEEIKQASKPQQQDQEQVSDNQEIEVANGGSLPIQEGQSQENEQVPEFVRTLFRDKRFRKFKKFMKELQERAVQETFKEPALQIIPQIESPQKAQEADASKLDSDITKDTLDDTKEQQAERKYQIILELLKRDVEQLEIHNRQQLTQQYTKFTNVFKQALETPVDGFIDQYPYRADEMEKYGVEFLSFIEPKFVQDYNDNMEWYKENFNEIMLNVCHPSKLEKDFLKHIEQEQQRKSDIKYKKILKQLEQGRKGGQILQDEEKQNSNSNMRMIAQDDAQCAICNNGDYEDEDMIVFCGNCNVPVHQSCYGIEQLPEGDWICYNCEMFGFKRGLMVKCLLCPKRGGAMKPTNIFTSAENYRKYNNTANPSNPKRPGKKGGHHYSTFASEKLKSVEELQVERKFIIGENEDKNLSLAVLLSREFDYQSKIRENHEKMGFPIETLDLLFDAHEKETMTPDDYSCFISKNESRLEGHHATQSLYEWIHLSCASWIPGPMVTPKTPVRMNKFDEKRFQLQCIICLKKEGACMQCQASRCQISFHVECARRSGYCMEIEKRDKDKSYKMFCEKHRPLKIVKEMEERDKQTIEEIQKFCKIIDKCMEIDYRHQLKPSRHSHDKEKESMRQSKSVSKMTKEKSRKEHGSHRERVKKWREKDKKQLFEQVKEKYLMFRKMRINIVRVDPTRKNKKSSKVSQRKRSKKRDSKKLAHIGGSRAGLRSAQSHPLNQDLEELKQDLPLLDQTEIPESPENPFIEEEKHQNTPMNDQSCKAFNEQSDMPLDQTVNNEEDDDGLELHYKLAIPAFPTEIDWTITLSRNDFPWHEIKFGIFTAKDCYEKFSSIVRDPQTFLKKVLGMKEKYKKMMQNQIQLGTAVLPQVQLTTTTQENQLYCSCKGNVISELYVKCDGDQECPNGGWVHPQCSNDLKEKSKQELDELDEWYCEDCRDRIKKEEDDEGKDQMDEDMEIEDNDEGVVNNDQEQSRHEFSDFNHSSRKHSSISGFESSSSDDELQQ